jgi:hypothetical protein
LESIWGIFFNQQKNLCKKLPHSGVAWLPKVVGYWAKELNPLPYCICQ